MARRVSGWIPLVLSASIVAAGTGVGCSEDAPTPATPAQESSNPPARVILISIDTLRADHLSIYGHERFTSPNLDALGREGAVFADASSTTAWTLPSHASMLTGLFPAEHGVMTAAHALSEDTPTLAGLLEEIGFKTAAVVNTSWLKRESFGVTQEFDEYRYIQDANYQRQSPSTLVTDQAIEWLLEARDEPLFLFIHYYDVHADYASLPTYERLFVEPYDGPADGSAWQLMRSNFAEEHIVRCQEAFDPALCAFGSKKTPRNIDEAMERISFSAEDIAHLEKLYDAGVRQMDDEIGRFVRFLRDEGMLDETLLIVTSDHGEEFGEHGRVDHTLTTYQESLRVPLIMRGPSVPAGSQVEAPVSTVDIVPTVLGLVTGRAPAQELGLSGLDLSPLLRGEGAAGFAERLLYGEASGGHNYDDALNGLYPLYYSVRRGRYKAVHDSVSGSFELFDLAEDPEEQNDISALQPGLTAELRGLLLARVEMSESSGGTAVELDPAEIQQLRALGYMVEGEVPEAGPAPDEPRGTEPQ